MFHSQQYIMEPITLCVISHDRDEVMVPDIFEKLNRNTCHFKTLIIGLRIKDQWYPVVNVKFTPEEGVIYLPRNMTHMWIWNSTGLLDVKLLDPDNYPTIVRMVVAPQTRADGVMTNRDDIIKACKIPIYVKVNMDYNEPECAFKIVQLESSDKQSLQAGFIYPEQTRIEVKPPVKLPVQPKVVQPQPPTQSPAQPSVQPKAPQPQPQPPAPIKHNNLPPISHPNPNIPPKTQLDHSQVKTSIYSKVYILNGEVVYVKPK